MTLPLLLSPFSRVWLCATPEMAAHQAPPSLGFSRQEHWSGLPFPSPIHESEKWKWSRSVMSNPQRPHGLQPTRLLRPWDFPGRSTNTIAQKFNFRHLSKGWEDIYAQKLKTILLLFSPSVMSNSSWPHGLQHPRLSCPSPFPGGFWSSCPSSWWYHTTISSSVVPFSSCLQFFPASGSFLISQFFSSGGQSIGASASASVLPMIIQDWFPLEFTGLISMQPKGLSRVFSNTTVQKQKFFSTQLSLWSNSHIHTWLLRSLNGPEPGGPESTIRK